VITEFPLVLERGKCASQYYIMKRVGTCGCVTLKFCFLAVYCLLERRTMMLV